MGADQSRRDGPGARHLQRRLRRLPHVLAGWEEAGVGVEPQRQGTARDEHFYWGLGAVGDSDLCIVAECEAKMASRQPAGRRRYAFTFLALLASHAVTAIIPHQPNTRTTVAICVSWSRTPRLEKILKKSCSTKSGSPVVTRGST